MASPLSETLRCRLVAACECTSQIDQAGGVTQAPDYDKIQFVSNPQPAVFVSPDIIWSQGIDAGVVGRTTDGKVILAFRGTLSSLGHDEVISIVLDWLNNTNLIPVYAPNFPGKVHQGFFSSLVALEQKGILDKAQALSENGRYPIIITGHSKGGALANLAAVALKNRGANLEAVVTFAAPRCGVKEFAEGYNAKLGDITYRFVNGHDVIPMTPPNITCRKDLDDVVGELRRKIAELPNQKEIFQLLDREKNDFPKEEIQKLLPEESTKVGGISLIIFIYLYQRLISMIIYDYTAVGMIRYMAQGSPLQPASPDLNRNAEYVELYHDHLYSFWKSDILINTGKIVEAHFLDGSYCPYLCNGKLKCKT